ncbi:NlpC/P60 family protein [Fontibacillus phaseoli]|uniref:NlpC/P60 family protein n=1 Tax=Fontibacillus phaseoli TaxID=1416533 RepID=A0A369BLR2_9BACL|nr:C40 family peptidase [Fontibacillus phaseoli]RCX21397.1 NlpC/P60 family protein [Fontibacillus phaseoli]
MRNTIWKRATLPILSGLLLVTFAACGNGQSGQSGPSVKSAPPSENPLIQTGPGGDHAQTSWIPLAQVADSLGLRLQETGNMARMGFTDVMFQVEPSQRGAVSFGKQISLSQAPIRQNGQTCLTEDALGDLLQTDVKLDRRTGNLQIAPLGNDEGQAENNPQQAAGVKRMSILSLSGNRDELISFAKQFLGTPYDFGASTYEQSKKFDCSSFTRHVFKRFGISLPRLAKDQAKVGTTVERSNLQTGDLIFFTVPGRFENDKIPGHVGIYIGDGKFIHTWGEPGVQISPLDTGYWHNVILFMRRVQ